MELPFLRRLLSLALAFFVKDLALYKDHAELLFPCSIKKTIFYEGISKFVLVQASYKARIFGQSVSEEKKRLYIIQKNSFIYLININPDFDLQKKIQECGVKVPVKILEK